MRELTCAACLLFKHSIVAPTFTVYFFRHPRAAHKYVAPITYCDRVMHASKTTFSFYPFRICKTDVERVIAASEQR